MTIVTRCLTMHMHICKIGQQVIRSVLSRPISGPRPTSLISPSGIMFCNLSTIGKKHIVQLRGNICLPELSSKGLPNNKPFSEDVKSQFSGKRLIRRKKTAEDISDHPKSGNWYVTAYATAEEYDLERLSDGLIKQNLYKPVDLSDDPLTKGGADVINAVANYELSSEKRQIYFFREGSVVFWNVPELECISVLDFLKHYQIGTYYRSLVIAEKEIMNYSYNTSGKKSALDSSKFCLDNSPGRCDHDINLEKFTLSNAMSLSVKLAIWEASLNHYIDSIEYVVEDLKSGKALRISRKEVTRKTGELFGLRHSINLSSDLLDVPDFYWENDELETLYLQLCSYFSISRRTRVMNEKLNHCMELVELLTSHLSDRHHVRLEWMIIVLIMIEVMIETLHILY